MRLMSLLAMGLADTARHFIAYHVTRIVRVQYASDDMAGNGPGLTAIAHPVIGCRLTEETRARIAQDALDDVASNTSRLFKSCPKTQSRRSFRRTLPGSELWSEAILGYFGRFHGMVWSVQRRGHFPGPSQGSEHYL
jgi:hypothetical protein